MGHKSGPRTQPIKMNGSLKWKVVRKNEQARTFVKQDQIPRRVLFFPQGLQNAHFQKNENL